MSWRPTEAGNIVLSDHQLAQIGLAVVSEARAKSVAASCLRAVENLTTEKWLKLERYGYFNDILKSLEKATGRLADDEFTARVATLREALENGHESRHVVVHNVWGETPNGPESFDYGRQRRLTVDDIRKAVEGCAKLSRASLSLAMRVAELIEKGVLEERQPGQQGMGIRTLNRLVHL